MTDKQKTKFSPGYRVQLSAVILRCVEREATQQDNQFMRDARYVAMQNLRKDTDQAQSQMSRDVVEGGQP